MRAETRDSPGIVINAVISILEVAARTRGQHIAAENPSRTAEIPGDFEDLFENPLSGALHRHIGPEELAQA